MKYSILILALASSFLGCHRKDQSNIKLFGKKKTQVGCHFTLANSRTNRADAGEYNIRLSPARMAFSRQTYDLVFKSKIRATVTVPTGFSFEQPDINNDKEFVAIYYWHGLLDKSKQGIGAMKRAKIFDNLREMDDRNIIFISMHKRPKKYKGNYENNHTREHFSSRNWEFKRKIGHVFWTQSNIKDAHTVYGCLSEIAELRKVVSFGFSAGGFIASKHAINSSYVDLAVIQSSGKLPGPEVISINPPADKSETPFLIFHGRDHKYGMNFRSAAERLTSKLNKLNSKKLLYPYSICENKSKKHAIAPLTPTELNFILNDPLMQNQRGLQGHNNRRLSQKSLEPESDSYQEPLNNPPRMSNQYMPLINDYSEASIENPGESLSQICQQNHCMCPWKSR